MGVAEREAFTNIGKPNRWNATTIRITSSNKKKTKRNSLTISKRVRRKGKQGFCIMTKIYKNTSEVDDEP